MDVQGYEKQKTYYEFQNKLTGCESPKKGQMTTMQRVNQNASASELRTETSISLDSCKKT